MTQQSGSPSSEGREIIIRPTGPEDKDGNSQYTDTALTGLLNMHAGQTTSARDLMWRRYGFFMLTNSVFYPLLLRIDVPIVLLLFGPFIGMLICWIWYALLQADRQVHIWRTSLASTFRYSHLTPDANVFVFALRPEQLAHGDKIYWYAGFLIWIFFGLYPVTAIYLGWGTLIKVLFPD